MKRTITSESLFEFANRKLPISLPKSDIDNEDENFEVGSKDEEWYGEDPEDQEIIDDIEHIDLGNEIIVDDEEKENKLSNVEDFNTYKTLLKHLKTIIDINKGKPDKEKNYISFTVKGKPGDVIDGIPFDVKGTKDQTTVTFIRKGTKNVKFVPLKSIILESEQHPHIHQMVKESLNEWSEYENESESDSYEDFLFKVANHMVQQWDQEVLQILDVNEFPPESEDLIVDLVNELDKFTYINIKSAFELGEDPEDIAEKIAMAIRYSDFGDFLE